MGKIMETAPTPAPPAIRIIEMHSQLMLEPVARLEDFPEGRSCKRYVGFMFEAHRSVRIRKLGAFDWGPPGMWNQSQVRIWL